MSTPLHKVVRGDGVIEIHAKAPPHHILQFHLELPPPPASNRYWRMNRGRVHVSHEARDYRLAVHLRATAAGLGTAKVGVWFPAGDVVVTIIWYRERKAGDLDGRLKVLLDALQGLAYTNDSQVKVLNAERRDEGEGRVVVSIKAYAP